MKILIRKHGRQFVTLEQCPECSSFYLEELGERSRMEFIGKGLWCRLFPMKYKDFVCNYCGCEFSVQEEE